MNRLICFLICILVVACDSSNKGESLIISNAIEYKGGYIELNDLADPKVSPTEIGLYKIGSQDYISIVSGRNLYLYNSELGANSPFDRIELNFRSQIKGYFIEADSTIFVVSSDSFIRLFSFEGEQIDSILVRFQSTMENRTTNVFGVFYEYPFIVGNNWFYIYVFNSTPVTDLEKTNQYYSQPIELIVDRENPNSIIQGGKYPDVYLSKKYYVYSPSRTINSKGIVVYSFASESELFVFNVENHKYEHISAESKYFIKNSEFDIDKLSDYNYISKYLTENYRYGTIVYDRYKNKYYRVCHHAYNYKNSDGTVNLWIDKPWSIIVIDSDFNIEKEILFEKGEYDFRNILVSELGILVARANRATSIRKITYDVFDF